MSADAPGPLPSPCVNICQLDAGRRWCTGCLRSLGEIAGWAKMDEAGKAAVWRAIAQRRAEGLPGVIGPAGSAARPPATPRR